MRSQCRNAGEPCGSKRWRRQQRGWEKEEGGQREIEQVGGRVSDKTNGKQMRGEIKDRNDRLHTWRRAGETSKKPLIQKWTTFSRAPPTGSRIGRDSD